jgi:NAD(P)-dependent dehydrogenase (short-subunit alcohol dehydrogenase family)
MTSLKGKVGLVTGGSRGPGRGIALVYGTGTDIDGRVMPVFHIPE